MHRPEFSALERALIAANVAPRFVVRTVQELSDHLDDIEADARANGMSPAQARATARAMLGSDLAIVAAVTARDELKCWYCRWPRSAAAVRYVAHWIVLPFVPLVYCAHHGGAIARWSASASLGAVVTGGLLFAMQLALL